MAKATRRSRTDDMTTAHDMCNASRPSAVTNSDIARRAYSSTNGGAANTDETSTTGCSQRTNCGTRKVHRSVITLRGHNGSASA